MTLYRQRGRLPSVLNRLTSHHLQGIPGGRGGNTSDPERAPAWTGWLLGGDRGRGRSGRVAGHVDRDRGERVESPRGLPAVREGRQAVRADALAVDVEIDRLRPGSGVRRGGGDRGLLGRDGGTAGGRGDGDRRGDGVDANRCGPGRLDVSGSVPGAVLDRGRLGDADRPDVGGAGRARS